MRSGLRWLRYRNNRSESCTISLLSCHSDAMPVICMRSLSLRPERESSVVCLLITTLGPSISLSHPTITSGMNALCTWRDQRCASAILHQKGSFTKSCTLFHSCTIVRSYTASATRTAGGGGEYPLLVVARQSFSTASGSVGNKSTVDPNTRLQMPLATYSGVLAAVPWYLVKAATNRVIAPRALAMMRM